MGSIAGVAQKVERLPCKQRVAGSNPVASSIYVLTTRSVAFILSGSFIGGVPKRPTGADCKSAGLAFVGSNPTPSTKQD